MGGEEEWNAYEELRKKNVERNQKVMHMLGLCATREAEENKPDQTPRSRKKRTKECSELRRSCRIAALQQSSLQSEKIEASASAVSGRILRGTSEKVRANKGKGTAAQEIVTSQLQEVRVCDTKMADYNVVEDDYSSDSSSDSLNELHVDMDMHGKNSVGRHSFWTQLPSDKQTPSSTAVNLDGINTQGASHFGTQFQEFMMRAFMQSTGALIGPPSVAMSSPQGGFTGSPLVVTQGMPPSSTWNEASYNKAEAKRKRRLRMTRTSAGEDSDSQKDFPVAENESPQQKSLRTRRLNRSRGRRAKKLTNNRTATNKLPYVLHVDGVGKARGIHKHQWRAAVRGQCGRLDPTMDNINHHPKHVVDSIWHALEKEWEFEGFVHRAREMFEKSATKFMRNRKMQLKYKCQKQRDDKKPNDVNDVYWSKIVDLTKKSTKLSQSCGSKQTTAKGKEKVGADEEQEKTSLLQSQGNEENSGRRTPDIPNTTDFVSLENDDIEARIQNLQKELLKLQECRKVASRVKEDGGTHDFSKHVKEESIFVRDRVLDGMKENVKPVNGNAQYVLESYGGTPPKKFDSASGSHEKRSDELKDAVQEIHDNHSTENKEEVEMECGDVVRLFAITGGITKEIGKGIVMGLAGSKYGKKVIPKGWRSIKVTSYTSIGAAESCPFPTGWIDGVKHRNVKEANGRMIVWPDSLLQSLLQK